MATVFDMAGLCDALSFKLPLGYKPKATGNWCGSGFSFSIGEPVDHCCPLKQEILLPMELFSLGLNHDSASVAVREKLAVSEGELGDMCVQFRHSWIVDVLTLFGVRLKSAKGHQKKETNSGGESLELNGRGWSNAYVFVLFTNF